MSIKICKTKCLASFAFFTTILSSCSGIRTERTSDAVGIYKERHEYILDSIVPELLKHYQVPSTGVALISKNSPPVIKVYGEHREGVRAPNNTIYNVASITKPIVATTVMKLVSNGDWNLDEPLQNYYMDPEIAEDPYSKLITTRHCLSHTTGFKNWRWNESDGKLNINFKPGTRFQYSGEGMELLRMAIEAKFKTGLERIMDSLLFGPVGMQDATMGWLSDRDTLRFAKWYDTEGNLHDIDYKIEKVNAADDLLVSMHDLAIFSKSLMQYKIIDRKAFAAMTIPQSTINPKLKQGLGWVMYDGLENLGKILNHDGGDPGVVATLILIPEHEAAIAISVNSDNGASVTNSILESILVEGKEIIEGLHWENEIPDKVAIDKKLLKEYSGTYTTDQGFDITFLPENNSLMTESPVFPRIKLWPKTENVFFPLPFEIYFRFEEVGETMQFNLVNSQGETELTGIR